MAARKPAYLDPVVEPATALDVTGYRGIVEYEPTELVLRVRAGTPIAEIEQTLAAEGQMLGFEPPAFESRATIGGTIACGTSGARRPWYGAARDFVLGVSMVTGAGDVCRVRRSGHEERRWLRCLDDSSVVRWARWA
ncbi:MAG: FAD-binding protein [Gammaproteobacteria bacterium]|nr:FAD-binding protein [Gammaproteobacteria bacterium]